jgi:putative ATP-dependent endonuclease of OLD family
LIDSTSNRYQNGSDVYIAHIIKTLLNEKQKNALAQAHRKLQGDFASDAEVINVNKIIAGIAQKSSEDKAVSLAIDLSSKNAWEHSFLTYVEDVPFHHIGKGEQAIVKTKLALEHKKAKEANIILLEEPENHLSHTKLNQLIKEIDLKCKEKQILISTHSSFVANKLGLENLILLNNKATLRLNQLDEKTYQFFQKIPGYDTLRLILCKKAILVEGDCDELLMQKAYMQKNSGRLPIEDGIDVISVGNTFLRFLEIAERVKKPVAVVTDNDGKVSSLKTKYENYLPPNVKAGISICFDETEDTGPIPGFNYNTLEPKFVQANSVELINKILGKERTKDELNQYMQDHKTECALKIFDTVEQLNFPLYISEAIK